MPAAPRETRVTLSHASFDALDVEIGIELDGDETAIGVSCVLRRYGVTVFIVDVVAVLVAVVAVAVVWGLSMRLVGQVAEEFGEDPARWRLLMLPFGIFGPVVARVLLSRNGGGRGGFS